jgi:hypothetical protein
MAKHTSSSHIYGSNTVSVLPQSYRKVFRKISERVWQKIEKRLDKQEKPYRNSGNHHT